MNRITNELCPLKNFRELKKNYKNLPLKITYKITDELSPSESFRELKKKFIKHVIIRYNSLTVTLSR
jgi:beta-xylosidase